MKERLCKVIISHTKVIVCFGIQRSFKLVNIGMVKDIDRLCFRRLCIFNQPLS